MEQAGRVRKKAAAARGGKSTRGKGRGRGRSRGKARSQPRAKDTLTLGEDSEKSEDEAFFTYKERPLHISDEEGDEDEQNDDAFVGLR